MRHRRSIDSDAFGDCVGRNACTLSSKVDEFNSRTDAMHSDINCRIEAINGRIDAMHSDFNSRADAIRSDMSRVLCAALNVRSDAAAGQSDSSFEDSSSATTRSFQNDGRKTSVEAQLGLNSLESYS
ncbi:MAG: hypothetical protein MHM6MM_007710 [Cercozoa sp. M6MM]